MNPVKCLVNSYEFFFLAMLFGTIGYVGGLLLTYRKPFNLESLLHRDKYNTDGVVDIYEPWTFRNTFRKIVGVSPDYTRRDKIIVWSIFSHTF